MEQIEVLLLLSSRPEKEWTTEAVFAQIQSSPAFILARLREFCDKGLLVEKSAQAYLYSPRTDKLANAVRLLAPLTKNAGLKSSK